MNVFSNSRCSKGQGKRMGRQMREEDGLADGRLSGGGGFREHLDEINLGLELHFSVLFHFQM